MRLKTLQQIILYKYRLIIGYAVFILAGISFGFWRLTNIAHGFSGSELNTILANSSWNNWAHLPLSPLTHFGQSIILKLWGVSLFGLRSVSVVIGLATLLFIYLSIRHWLGRTIAILASTLIVSSSQFLLQARQATGSIELLFWLALTCYFVWKLHETGKKKWWFGWCLSMVGLSYNQGGIWVLLAILTIAVFDTEFRKSLQRIKSNRKSIGIFIYLAGIAPIIYLGLKTPSLINRFLNIGSNINFSQYIQNLANNFVSIFMQTPSIAQSQGLSGRYVVHFTLGALFILGLLALVKGYHFGEGFLTGSFRRTALILLVIGLFISSLSSSFIAKNYVIFPVILVMSTGIWLLMKSWASIYPLNPYARTLGLILIISLVAISVFSNYKFYFDAWGYAPQTSYTFSPQLMDLSDALKKHPAKTCVVSYANNETIQAELLPSTFGLINKNRSCTPTNTASSTATNQPVRFISANTWNNMNLQQKDQALPSTHYPVVNSRSQKSLDYWVFLP